VTEIADKAIVRGASIEGATQARASAATAVDWLPPLADIPPRDWRALSERAVEPNGYYLPEWALAVNASARDRTGSSALAAWSDAPLAYDGPARLIGLLPVISLWRAQKIPLPALVSAQPYGTLCTPPLDRDAAESAAEARPAIGDVLIPAAAARSRRGADHAALTLLQAGSRWGA
jgi:hypothetical protein